MDVIRRLKEMKSHSNEAVKDLIDILISNMEIDELTNSECSRWMYDICRYGSHEGTIPEFIYNKQCTNFFKKHCEQILDDLRDEFQCQVDLCICDMVYCWVDCWTETLFDRMYVVK